MPKKILMICGETCVKCKFLKPHLEARAQGNGILFEEKDINEAIPSEIEWASSLPVIWFDDKQIEYDEALAIISNNNG